MKLHRAVRSPSSAASVRPHGSRRRRTLVAALLALGLAACSDPGAAPPDPTLAQNTRPAPVSAKPVAPTPSPLPPVVEPVKPAAPRLTAPNDGEVRVGLLLPLSGEAAALGEAFRNAVLLALHDIGNARVRLLVRDTAADPATAEAAARDVLQQGAQLVLGPLTRASTQAAASATRARATPMIAFSSDETVAGESVYLLSLTPRQEISRVVGQLARQGFVRLAALAPASPYGELAVSLARSEAQAALIDLVDEATYFPGDEDVQAAVRRIADFDNRRAALVARKRELAVIGTAAAKDELRRLQKADTYGPPPYDALLVPDSGASLQAVAPFIPYFDIDPADVRLVGTGLWDSPEALNEPALKGGWFAAPEPVLRADFTQRYQAMFGAPAPRLATLAYDAGLLAAALAGEAGPPAYDTARLTDPEGFAGADGIFRFRADGRADRGLAILELDGRGGVTVVDPAPERFPPALLN